MPVTSRCVIRLHVLIYLSYQSMPITSCVLLFCVIIFLSHNGVMLLCAIICLSHNGVILFHVTICLSHNGVILICVTICLSYCGMFYFVPFYSCHIMIYAHHITHTPTSHHYIPVILRMFLLCAITCQSHPMCSY